MSEPEPVESLIASGCGALGVAVDATAIERLSLYVTWLLRWNESINLVGPCTEEEAVTRHVLDSLALLRLLERPEVGVDTRPWFDVGAGAGIPGLILAVARPDLELHVVEPRGRRATFCKQVASAMEVERLTVHPVRLEAMEMPAGSGAMSRATFAPQTWARRGLEAVGPDGCVIVMMGSGAPDELLESSWIVDRFVMPGTGHARVNAVVRAP